MIDFVHSFSNYKTVVRDAVSTDEIKCTPTVKLDWGDHL